MVNMRPIVQSNIVKRQKFRHPLDNPNVKSMMSGRSQEYKVRRMSYPHQILRQKDPIFRQNWDHLRTEHYFGRISERKYEELFFGEVSKAIQRRRASLQ